MAKNPKDDGSQDPTPVTEHVQAPVPQAALPAQRLPRHKQVERSGDISSPVTVRWPQVRGGICEFCGVLDPNQPSHMQYKLCGHYRGMQLRCTYCPRSKDVNEVIDHSIMNVAEHPDNPDKLVVWCDSYDCSKKHTERFSNAS